jgi:hypothetical protein
MPQQSLSEFVNDMEKTGMLVRIETFYERCQAPVIFYAARICWRAIFARW